MQIAAIYLLVEQRDIYNIMPSSFFISSREAIEYPTPTVPKCQTNVQTPTMRPRRESFE
jgi:hypothetical protein